MRTRDVLNLEFQDPEYPKRTYTVREYFKAQLRALWTEQDTFSGKRPLGNSGWDWVFAVPFAKAGLITVTWEDESQGWIDNIEDEDEYYRIIQKCIDAL